MFLGNDLVKDDDTKKNSIDRRDFGIVFYELYLCLRNDLAKRQTNSTDCRDFGIVFYEVYICAWGMISPKIKKKSIERRDFWVFFYEVYICAWGMISPKIKKLYRSQRFLGLSSMRCIFVPGE